MQLNKRRSGYRRHAVLDHPLRQREHQHSLPVRRSRRHGFPADAEQPYRPALFALLQRQHQAPESGPGYGAGQLHVSVLIEAWREFSARQSCQPRRQSLWGFYCDPYEAAGAAAEGDGQHCVLPLEHPPTVPSASMHKSPALRRGFSGRGSVARFYLNQRLVRNRRHGLALTTQAGRRVRSGDTQLRLRVAVRIGFHPLQASGVDDVVQGLGLGGRRCRRMTMGCSATTGAGAAVGAGAAATGSTGAGACAAGAATCVTTGSTAGASTGVATGAATGVVAAGSTATGPGSRRAAALA